MINLDVFFFYAIQGGLSDLGALSKFQVRAPTQ